MGYLASWGACTSTDVVSVDAITLIHLPNGPTAYFKLSSIRSWPSAHYPELVLNGFVTRLGHAVGRMFQTLFPPLPEFEGRQVVTLHNQRDFLFFRRHRYVFKSTEKTGLQEIGPRFTLKLRWLKKGVPAIKDSGSHPGLQLADSPDEQNNGELPEEATAIPKETDYEWLWQPKMEVNRRTFFL